MSEKVFFKNSSGQRLVGLLDHVSDKVIVGLHGFESDKTLDKRRIFFSKPLIEEGFSFFTFDFSGNGESQGSFDKTSIKKRSEDFKAALKFLKSRGYNSFGVIGFSMGGAVAIKSWTKKIKALSLIVPLTQPKLLYNSINNPDSLIDLVEKKWFKQFKTKDFFSELKKTSFDNRIKKITSPTLIVQAKQDTLIEKNQTKKTYRLLECRKKYVEVTGTHLVLIPLSFMKVVDETVKWFKKWM